MIFSTFIGAISFRPFRALPINRLYCFSNKDKICENAQQKQMPKKKSFLSNMRKQLNSNSTHKPITKSSNKQQQHFIKAYKPILQISIKTPLPNVQRHFFESDFFLKDLIDLHKTLQHIEALDLNIVDQEMKSQLIKCLKQVCSEREILIEHQFSSEWFYEEYNKYTKKEQSFVYHFLNLSTRISSIIERILIKCESLKSQSFSIHIFLLSIIKLFNFHQFYLFYLSKLVEIQAEQIVETITHSEAQLAIQIIETLSQINYQHERNTMPINIQRSGNDFFDFKLQQIFSHFTQFSLNQKVSLLTRLQKIFDSTHLTFAKHYFYVQFLNHHINELQKSLPTQKQITLKNVDFIIDMFWLLVNNIVLDEKLINRFNIILGLIASNETLDMFQPQRATKIMEIYSKIGGISQVVYKKLVSRHLHTTFANNEYNFVQALKFYLYSDCKDWSFLDKFFSKFTQILNSQELISNKRSRHTLHFLVHFFCIKYPTFGEYKASLKALDFCESHSGKDFKVLREILREWQEKKKVSQKDSIQQIKNKRFLSPCIAKETRQIQNNYKSKQSELQEHILKQNLKVVIKELNQERYEKQFYEIQSNFSFCIFELDFAVLKWDSANRQKLLSYLDIECVGLQYSYDIHEKKNYKETKKMLNSTSMIEYEKGLRVIRKKVVREMILKHYGWKVLYVPNKYLYYQLMERKRLQQELKKVIITKLS